MVFICNFLIEKKKAVSGKSSPALWHVFRLSHIALKQSKRPPKEVLVLSLKALLGYCSEGPQPNMHFFPKYHRSDTFPKRDVSPLLEDSTNDRETIFGCRSSAFIMFVLMNTTTCTLVLRFCFLKKSVHTCCQNFVFESS